MIQLTAQLWLDPATGLTVSESAGYTVVHVLGTEVARLQGVALEEIVGRVDGSGKDVDIMEAYRALRRVTAATTLAEAKRHATEELRRRFADWQSIKT